MNEYFIRESTLSDIATAIRNKTGITDPFPVSSMAMIISEIEIGGNYGDFKNKYFSRTLRKFDDSNGIISYVQKYVFESFYSLQAISFPNAINIGSYAFDHCYSLQSISLPNVITIGIGAFRSCFSLQSISLSNATTIGDGAFNSCTSLQSISLPNATTIGESAFYNCSSLQSISLPNAITIGENAFSRCSSLQSISLPNATTIGSSAFYWCSSLSIASLPVIQSIGSSAFCSCTHLKKLYINNVSSVPTLGSYVFDSTPFSKSTLASGFGSIYVPGSLLQAFKSATGWRVYSARIVSV